MKIAQVTCVFPPQRGGIGSVARDYADIAKRQGHEITVFTPSCGQKEAVNGIKVFRLKPFLKYGNAAFLPQLFFYLIKSDFNLVHLHYPFFGGIEPVWLVKFLFPKKFKLVVHYHMDVIGLPWYIKILSWPTKLITASLFNIADKVTCASIDYVQNSDLKKVYQKNHDKFVEIPFGVDTEKFFPAPERKRLNTVLFVSVLDQAHYFKGLSILIKAIARIDNIKLRIVGDGDSRFYYEELVKKEGIEGRVKFLGGLNDSDLIKEYQAASVLVLPSINKGEAFGMVLLEAMSSGTPVIASSLPGVRQVFSDSVEGFLAEPSNAEALADKIKYFFSNPETIKQLSVDSRRLALEKYSQKIIGQKLLNIYEDLLN